MGKSITLSIFLGILCSCRASYVSVDDSSDLSSADAVPVENSQDLSSGKPIMVNVEESKEAPEITVTVPLAPGEDPECECGGEKTMKGLDLNFNGELDEEEVLEVTYSCPEPVKVCCCCQDHQHHSTCSHHSECQGLDCCKDADHADCSQYSSQSSGTLGSQPSGHCKPVLQCPAPTPAP